MLRVSVIIPTYNRAGYLVEALQSVSNQLLPPHEVIVIDDGSTDDTAQVAHSFGPNIRYFLQEHKGVSAARNLGLERSQGDAIAWLDADDLWEPEFLATLATMLEENPELHGVYSGCSHIDAAGEFLPQSSHRVEQPSGLFSALVDGNFIATPAIVVRKRCYEQVGNFDTQLGICEDYDMWLRLARDFTIAGVPARLVRIRVHEHNTVADTAAFCRFRLALTEKHFGKPEGDPQTWSAERRRAHAFAFRSAALRSIQGGQPDRGWRLLEKAITIWPDLFNRIDTFYELACGEQPRGYRGHVASLDLERNGAATLRRLDRLFAEAGLTLEPMRRTAYGNAYLALTMLNDQAGRWGAARHYMLQTIKANPRLLGSFPVIRRLIKLNVGKRLVNAWRSVRQASPRLALGEADLQSRNTDENRT